MVGKGDEVRVKALGTVAEADARVALGRLVQSPAFRNAPQLSAFLSYIVSRTLDGHAHEIKGYTIAVEALGRPADFDPVADPIVRVEAGRLRRAIESYYAADGAHDHVRIVVERGSYVPNFVVHHDMAGKSGAGKSGEGVSGAGVSGVPELAALTEDVRTRPVGVFPLPAGVLSLPDALSPVLHSQVASTIDADIPAGADRVHPHVEGHAASVALPARPAPAMPSRWPAKAAAAVLVLVGLGLFVWWARPMAATFARLSGAETSVETSAAKALPTISVVALPSNNPLIDDVSRQFSESLTDALARFDEFVILDSAARPQGAASYDNPSSYRLEHRGQISGTSVTAVMRLIHVVSGRIVWTTNLDQDASIISEVREVRELARRVVVRLAQPYGVIHGDLRTQNLVGTQMFCVVKTYDYWNEPTEKRHADVRSCLEAVVKSDPLFHPAWALLSMIHLDEYRIGYNPREGTALDRARYSAQKAVSLSPESARALQALMAVQTVSGETEAAIRTGFAAVRRNPYDTDILADLGARLTQAGRAREGRPLLLRAADLNMARPAWHDFYLYLSARETGDIAGAKAALRSLELIDAPLALLGRALAASDAGKPDYATVAMRKLSDISPVFGRDAGEFLDRAFFAPDVRAMLIEALNKGGLATLRKG